MESIPELSNLFYGADFFVAPALLLELLDREFAIIDGQIDGRLRSGRLKNARKTGNIRAFSSTKDETLGADRKQSLCLPAHLAFYGAEEFLAAPCQIPGDREAVAINSDLGVPADLSLRNYVDDRHF